jgi:hypothetical protein
MPGWRNNNHVLVCPVLCSWPWVPEVIDCGMHDPWLARFALK